MATEPARASGDERPRARRHLAAALLFLLVLPLAYPELWGEDLTQVALVPAVEGPASGPGGLRAGDLRFVIWLVARNAYTLLNRPGELFAAEPCHPSPDALALGEPGLTLGLLATPAWALRGDPVLCFHFAQFATLWVAAFAMYLLVSHWTRSFVAGVVAAALYAFDPVRINNVVHPYVGDTGWTVLAFFFATRLFERGRWRDGLGLGVCAALQMGGSLYPLLGALALGLPMLVWLVVRCGFRSLRTGPALLAVAIAGAAAAFVYTPYLALSTVLEPRHHFFIPWDRLLPGPGSFFGWLLAGLALLGLVLRQPPGRPNPRFALLAGAALVSLLATGGTEGELLQAISRGTPAPGFKLPNLYRALSSVVPGLDVVRAPGSLFVCLFPALGALAGLGAAALLSRASRWPEWRRVALAAVLVVTALAVPLRAALPFVGGGARFAPLQVAPAPETLALYRELAMQGNAGPILDAPITRVDLRGVSESVLLSAYHHRRTSACWASFAQPEAGRIAQLAATLPGPAAVRGLAELGFTTVVRRHMSPTGSHLRVAWQHQSLGTLRVVGSAHQRTVWSIDAPPTGAGASRERPNIVLIIADDLGWPDMGFMGSEVAHTPNLDRLAAEGTRFTHAFNTASSCRPSLASLLTGLQPIQLRAAVRPPARAREETPRGVTRRRVEALQRLGTLPARLTAHGYATFQGGKHWEGSFLDAGFSHGVTEQEAGILTGGGPSATAIGRETLGPVWEFLDAHREGPFFLWFAPLLPHAPFDAPEEYAARYAGAGEDAPYLANVTRFDAVVGMLLDHLDELGVRDDTLVVFLSDNGWDIVSEGAPLALLSGGPKGKASVHELGFRTPLVFQWPGVLPRGLQSDRLVSTLDLFPTLLEFASVPLPPGRPGESLVPLLTGGGDFQRSRVAGHIRAARDPDAEARGLPRVMERNVWFLRDGEWRYLWFPEEGRAELYRIEDDPWEEEDLAPARPEVAARLHAELEEEMRSLPPR